LGHTPLIILRKPVNDGSDLRARVRRGLITWQIGTIKPKRPAKPHEHDAAAWAKHREAQRQPYRQPD
jgi:hypothetical protein